jgi:hypothetical protein
MPASLLNPVALAALIRAIVARFASKDICRQTGIFLNAGLDTDLPDEWFLVVKGVPKPDILGADSGSRGCPCHHTVCPSAARRHPEAPDLVAHPHQNVASGYAFDPFQL